MEESHPNQVRRPKEARLCVIIIMGLAVLLQTVGLLVSLSDRQYETHDWQLWCDAKVATKGLAASDLM